MRKNSYPEMTDTQKKRALEMYNLGYGVPKINQDIRNSEANVRRFLNDNAPKRTKEEMIALRKKNGIVFTAGKRGL